MPNSSTPSSVNQPVDEEAIAMIMSMGFSKEKAVKALQATDNNIERATDWIFSHADDMEEETPKQSSSSVLEGKGSKKNYNRICFKKLLNSSFQIKKKDMF